MSIPIFFYTWLLFIGRQWVDAALNVLLSQAPPDNFIALYCDFAFSKQPRSCCSALI
jgi:hypothetical protein